MKPRRTCFHGTDQSINGPLALGDSAINCRELTKHAGVSCAQLCFVVPDATSAPWQVVEFTSFLEPTTGLRKCQVQHFSPNRESSKMLTGARVTQALLRNRSGEFSIVWLRRSPSLSIDAIELANFPSYLRGFSGAPVHVTG